MKKNSVSKRKTLKVILISILAFFVLIALAVFILWFLNGKPSFGFSDVLGTRAAAYSDTASSLEREGFAADALYLVETLESSHPIFVIDGWLAEDYVDIRDEFLDYSRNNSITRLDFAFAAARYITTLRDGHMNTALIEDTHNLVIFGGRLDIRWLLQNNRLFLVDENGDITNKQITHIGNVSTTQVLAVVNRYYYMENEADRIHRLSHISRFGDVIEKAGGEIINNTVQIMIDEDGVLSVMDVRLLSMDDLISRSSQSDYIIRHEMIGDVFFIDLRTFVDGEHITETAKAIERVVANGTRKFVVDLRGNSGGNSSAGRRLLEAMGIKVPQYGATRRISDLMVANPFFWIFRVPRLFGVSYVHFEPVITANNNPNNVFVSVLTDSGTYSSATMMGVWVQDGGFGNVIGTPSPNSPNAFGDTGIRITLPYSGITVAISTTQFLRPDVNADPITLNPDIMTDPADALDVALDFLHSLNGM